VAFVTQTTLSMDDTRQVIEALKRRFPSIAGPKKNDICYATQNRQDAVKNLAGHCDLVLVVGSPNSSNSNRLREIAAKSGTPAYLIDGPEDIRREWIEQAGQIGVTAGASAPEVLVEEVIEACQARFRVTIEEVTVTSEDVEFKLPRDLRTAAARPSTVPA
jgi:4-hydroxy-3-methylbut-2-enyl diphosphate reductase